MPIEKMRTPPVKLASGEKHILFPQVDVGIEGLRYDKKYASQKEALAEYNKNKELYEDLEEWEIEDGIIPGELVLSTRIPADDLHSHTLSRARNKLNGNFTVLDKESQARSGSDYDGDQRFNQVLFKNKKGQIPVLRPVKREHKEKHT